MIIDSHFHLGYIRGYFNYDWSLENALKVMDRLNITHAVQSHIAGLLLGDLELAVRECIKAYETSNGRILSLHTFNANKGEECMEIIEKYDDRNIFRGIKFAACVDFVNMDDERYEVMWKYASENNLPILAHTWDASTTNPGQNYSLPTMLEQYIEKYPKVRLIMGHSAGRYEAIRQAVRIGKKFSNVYFDTSGDVYINSFIEYIVKEIGSERILFGSDYGMMDMRNNLGLILGAEIPLEDKKNILYRSAAKLWSIKNTEGGCINV